MIGREKEFEQLNDAYDDDRSRFIAVYGRRGIGKTYLINEPFKGHILFHHVGIQDAPYKTQLSEFSASLGESGHTCETAPANWFDAFRELKRLIEESKEPRKVIFIDELSWMDTPKSDMMKALESFWNGWANTRDDVVLVVCASATSWMLKKVIHNKGGLYNRVTDRIRLNQFSLKECEDYFAQKGFNVNRMQILQYYMILGGVPYYYTLLKKGLSVPQNIDALFFNEDAPLKKEYQYLFASIFKHPKPYMAIIEALGRKKVGLSREELIKATKLKNSGGLTTKLEELESCGFIRKYNCFGMKSKNALYQIVDSFLLFYYSFLEKEPNDENFWEVQTNSPAVNAFLGYAFEKVCLLHVKQMKEKLGVSGVLTEVNSWFCKKDDDEGLFGSQIDLLIVRKDQVINVCEMKYSQTPYIFTKKDLDSLNRKIHDFQTATKTRYALYPTLVVAGGLKKNANSMSIQSVITLDDLFK